MSDAYWMDTVHLTACLKCGAPAQAIAEPIQSAAELSTTGSSVRYRYVRPVGVIADLQIEVKRWTSEKGWKDDRTVGDLLMLMVRELSEAMEEWRDWHEPNEIYVHAGKPEGIPIELADVVIRVLSFCGKYDIDLQDAILRKMAYNETRPYRHGGKRV